MEKNTLWIVTDKGIKKQKFDSYEEFTEALDNEAAFEDFESAALHAIWCLSLRVVELEKRVG